MTDVATILGAALAVTVGVIFAFGHKYTGESAKFDEKSKADELKEIRIAIREDTTVPAINRLWQFLVESEQAFRREGRQFDLGLLFYDVNRREQFNEVINQIERSFRNAMEIRTSWDALRDDYNRLGRTFYALAIVVSVGGYATLIVASITPAVLTSDIVAGIVIIALFAGATFSWRLFTTGRKITTNDKQYRDARDRYLIDELRMT